MFRETDKRVVVRPMITLVFVECLLHLFIWLINSKWKFTEVESESLTLIIQQCASMADGWPSLSLVLTGFSSW